MEGIIDVKKALLTFAVGITAFAAMAPASAATFDIQGISTVHTGPSGELKLTGSTHSGSFSPQNITGIWNGELVSFLAYCLELTQSSGTGSFNVVSLSDYVDATRASTIAALISSYAGSGDAANDAALQLALWEARHENGNSLDLGTGRLKLQSVDGMAKDSLTNKSNAYLSSLGPIDDTRQFWVATNDNLQDFVFYTVKPAVPEPATWAMMFIGFASIGRAMRSRKKTLAVSFS